MFDDLTGWFAEHRERRDPSAMPGSAGMVERICEATRWENRAAAAQLDAIWDLFSSQLARHHETEDWAIDTMEAVSAEVAAALRISQGLAGSRLRYARAMRERLPKVAELFRAGEIDFRMFTTIVYRTDLIEDPALMAAVDAQLAANVARWPSMSRGRLAGAIDKIVVKADRDALRARIKHQVGRQVYIGVRTDGLCELSGSLLQPHGQALDQRLNALAATVCPHDPRTRDQRRADALGALAAGADRLGCRCGRPDCVAGARRAASPVVIHVIAEQATVDGTGSTPGSEIAADGLIPAEVIAELAATSRQIALTHPGESPPEPGYTPSKALADFVRCRDLTCRWPGCDHPAWDCDVDHTIPYSQGGPTHAANLKCLCRTHHLVKTFFGWHEKQLPHGTLILTSPAGHTHVSAPGSALLFPTLCAPAGGMPALHAHHRIAYCPERVALMPKRRRTRAQDRAQRVATERSHNRKRLRQAYQAAQPKQPSPDDEPPPF
ncbi:MAG: HNH endonuclease signature motif containing protein [Mycobacterium sp.]